MARNGLVYVEIVAQKQNAKNESNQRKPDPDDQPC